MLIPYGIETLEQEKPVANWVIIGICGVVFFGAVSGVLSQTFIDGLVLDGLNPVGLIGHMFVHGGLIHLIGNMIFLWVFGNAVCSNTNNAIYPVLFLVAGIFAALVHLVLDGSPAVGASGAINGITGIVLAMYPSNRVYVFWFALFRWETFVARASVIIIVWLLFDILWLVVGRTGIAFFAHIGGLMAGVGIGLLCLDKGWIQTTYFDNETSLDFIKRKRQASSSRSN